LNVTVLERSSRIGGRAASDTSNGFVFNRGVHALYRGGAATRVLDELGVEYSGGSPGSAFALAQGRLHPIPTSLPLLLRTGLLGPLDKIEIARLFRSLPQLRAADFARVSVQDWLGQHLHSGRVRRLLSALARTFLYSPALEIASAEVFIERVQLALGRPVLYIDGGWQTIVEGLRSVAEAGGAAVRTTAGVEEIGISAAAGVVLKLSNGETLRTRAVVLAAAPREVTRLLGERLSPGYRASLDATVPAQVACLDVALNGASSSRYPAIQDIDSPRFLATQSSYARISPAGSTALQMVKQLQSDVPTDPIEDQRDLEGLIGLAQPGWQRRVVDRVFLPRMEASTMLPTAAGGGLAGRPAHAVPGIEHCYLAGDWIGPEGYLLDASLASARRVAELIAGSYRGTAAPAIRVPDARVKDLEASLVS
jgi:phytoene dehydrogenase-like protein